MELEPDRSADNALEKIVKELLENYGDLQLLRVFSQAGDGSLTELKPTFNEGLYYHEIQITKSGCQLVSKCLKGRSILELASEIYKTFKHGACLLASTHNGDGVMIGVGDGTGSPEKFMMQCELLGIEDQDGKQQR